VFTTEYKPVAGVILDFWQADAEGQYDNTGYILRGHDFTDAAGRYQLDTIMPGLYPEEPCISTLRSRLRTALS